MLAAYTVIADIWVDMPEAKPRARARVKNNRPDAELIVEDDGTLTFSEDADIEIDTYGGPKYVDIRKEIRISTPINAFASDKKIISVTGENAPVVKPVKEDKSASKPVTKVGKDK